jgi:hypothetical protein
MTGKLDQRTVVDDVRLGILTDHRALHPIVQDLASKVSISLLSELAREAGEAQSVGNADRPHIQRPSW